MKADGRSTVQLNVPNGAADAANKRVTADAVNVVFNDNGKDIRHAEAVGNAELYVEPLRALAQNYRTTIYAPRFDCEFYPSGNNAKDCVGSTKTKTVREPTVAADNRGTQNLFADKLTAVFNEGSKDVESLQAAGDTKFTELDRNAVGRFDDVHAIRSGGPDAEAVSRRFGTAARRPGARNRLGYAGTAFVPERRCQHDLLQPQKDRRRRHRFGSSDKPVFTTSQSMDIDQRTQVAVFNGNARAWQDNNYVRADQLVIDQQNGTFKADGSVQSLLYDAKQKRKAASASVPVYAAAATMNYSPQRSPLAVSKIRRYQAGNGSAFGRKRRCFS